MKRTYQHIALFFIKPSFPMFLLPFYVFPVVSVFAQPHLILSAASVRPGDTLRVELNGTSPHQTFRARWGEKSYPFYPVGPSAHRALIGIPLGTPSETFPLVVQDITGSRPPFAEVARSVVEISSRVYATENVNFSKETNALKIYERREGKLISAKKKYLSRDQLWEGIFLTPVDGPVIGEFGVQRLHNGKTPAGFHNGVDVRAKTGTPVRAANAGVVLLAARFKAHGQTVLINHGQGVMSIYLHMSRLRVQPGQKVNKGDRIGDVGSTGLSTAPHLHWQIYVHGVQVDPQAWLDKDF